MTDTVIKCDSVYKIFGSNAKKMLQEAKDKLKVNKPRERYKKNLII
jgi:ABC-type proline/glycine betaine transport system ATPase subunit